MLAPESLEGTVLPGQLQAEPQALSLLAVGRMAVEGVDQRVEEGQMAVDGQLGQGGVVTLPLRQYLVGAAAEEVDRPRATRRNSDS